MDMDILALHNSPEEIAARTAAIAQALIEQSLCIKSPNFEHIGPDDLSRLIELYDAQFLGGWLLPAVRQATGIGMLCRLSSTMTRAGGKTFKYHGPGPGAAFVAAKSGLRRPTCFYEIAISSRLLFITFGQVDRPVEVCGLPCRDRLSALQRFVEHELIHLAELLIWDESSCAQPRFKHLVRRIFGHRDTKHALVTPREHAAVSHGVRVGQMVEFDHDGQRLVGRVNRISRRATILVEDPHGRRYTDGHTYAKFYVPLAALRPVADQTLIG